jgi:hypothetical protein
METREIVELAEQAVSTPRKANTGASMSGGAPSESNREAFSLPGPSTGTRARVMGLHGRDGSAPGWLVRRSRRSCRGLPPRVSFSTTTAPAHFELIKGFRVLPDFPIVQAKAALPRFGHAQIVLPAQRVWKVAEWQIAFTSRGLPCPRSLHEHFVPTPSIAPATNGEDKSWL